MGNLDGKSKMLNFSYFPGPSFQRSPARFGPRVRGQGQRPSPHGHQREGRPLRGATPGLQAGLRQGELRLKATEPSLRKVSIRIICL